ncbi:GRAM domain-containing protein [Ditylenchus destructor]|uniref:GRAM domain-containing protein n=1 Tax=Ditylenchus destructor TaxID=166010 RepID=A0AAD4NDY2_9BILA|nr:GRAM domain-containing protein [Ditylenchus destructor]
MTSMYHNGNLEQPLQEASVQPTNGEFVTPYHQKLQQQLLSSGVANADIHMPVSGNVAQFLPPLSSSSAIDTPTSHNVVSPCGLSDGVRAGNTLPSAAELFSNQALHSNSRQINSGMNMSENNMMMIGTCQYGNPGPSNGGQANAMYNNQAQQALPPISAFGQQQNSHMQPVPSPCMPPPSPYLVPPGSYHSITEPSTPAPTPFYPPSTSSMGPDQQHGGSQAQSPSFCMSMHSMSNPGSIMSAPPESPASVSNLQRSPSVKSAYSVRMTNSTPDFSTEINHYQNSTTFYNAAPPSTATANDLYGITNATRYAPLYGTQQSVMLTNAMPQGVQISLPLNKSRNYKSPGYPRTGRTPKSTLSSMLPILPVRSSGDDGPTVKEHLQQQQMAQRQKMQQEQITRKLRHDDIPNRDKRDELTNSPQIIIETSPQKALAQDSMVDPQNQLQTTNSKTPKMQIKGAGKSCSSGAKKAVFRTNSGNPPKSRSYVSRVNRLASTIASVASGQSGSFETLAGGNPESPTFDDAHDILDFDEFVGDMAENDDMFEKRTSPHPQLSAPHLLLSSSPSTSNPSSLSNPTPPRPLKRAATSIAVGVPVSTSSGSKRGAASVHAGLDSTQQTLSKPLDGGTSIAHPQPAAQCRIHVQNPPNSINDFPPTETTIQVVQHSQYQEGRYVHVGDNGQQIISVQQRPSVAHIQQQKAAEALLKCPENAESAISSRSYQLVNASDHMRKEIGNTVQHVIVQNANASVVSFNSDSTPVYAVPTSSVVDMQQIVVPTTKPQVCTQLVTSSTIPTTGHRQQKALEIGNKASLYSAPGQNVQLMTAGSVVYRVQQSEPHTAVRPKDIEFRKYSIKLYHLQRTIKALVYKNGALSDELARLNQRIYSVTEERRMLAKKLQHHERNRIRRLQTQHRKAAAAARKDGDSASEPRKKPGRKLIQVNTFANDQQSDQHHSVAAFMKSPSSVASSSGTRNHSPQIVHSPKGPSFGSSIHHFQIQTSSFLSATEDDPLMGMTLRSRSNSSTTDLLLHQNRSPSQQSERRSSTSTQNSSFNSTSTIPQNNTNQRSTRHSARQLHIQQERLERQQQHSASNNSTRGRSRKSDSSSPKTVGAQETKNQSLENIHTELSNNTGSDDTNHSIVKRSIAKECGYMSEPPVPNGDRIHPDDSEEWKTAYSDVEQPHHQDIMPAVDSSGEQARLRRHTRRQNIAVNIHSVQL